MNPSRGAYHGYTQANQSAAEEEYSYTEATEEVDLEAGRSIFHSTLDTVPKFSKAQGKRRVAWDGGTSELKTLHPNIHEEDTMHEQESSDDEVPQSFKVEPIHAHLSSRNVKPEKSRKGQAGRKLAPTATDESRLPISAPETNRDKRAYLPDHDLPLPNQPRTFMRGLDDYEKALWNWVNVYNLDAFLQEVYYYYDGKGIYSITLARGLNLL